MATSDDHMMSMLLDSIPSDIAQSSSESNSDVTDEQIRDISDFEETVGPDVEADLQAPVQSEQNSISSDRKDPVFEASIEGFRRNGFPIRRDDETYAVMEFMHLAMRNMETQFQNERRVEMDRLFSMLKDLNDKNEETAVVLKTLMSEQQEAATHLGKRLIFTARESVVRFAAAFKTLQTEAHENIQSSAKILTEIAEAEFNKELRKLVRDETRIGLAAGIETEVGVLAKGVKQATTTLSQASKMAAARSGKGWLINMTEDFKSLSTGAKISVAGAAVLVLGVLIFR